MKLFNKVLATPAEIEELKKLREYQKEERKRHQASQVNKVREESQRIIDGLNHQITELDDKNDSLSDKVRELEYQLESITEREAKVIAREVEVKARETRVANSIEAAVSTAKAEVLREALTANQEVTKDILNHGNLQLALPEKATYNVNPGGAMPGAYPTAGMYR